MRAPFLYVVNSFPSESPEKIGVSQKGSREPCLPFFPENETEENGKRRKKTDKKGKARNPKKKKKKQPKRNKSGNETKKNRRKWRKTEENGKKRRKSEATPFWRPLLRDSERTPPKETLRAGCVHIHLAELSKHSHDGSSKEKMTSRDIERDVAKVLVSARHREENSVRWPQRKTLQAGGGYKNPIKTRKTISTTEIFPLWTPFFSAKTSSALEQGGVWFLFPRDRKICRNFLSNSLGASNWQVFLVT